MLTCPKICALFDLCKNANIPRGNYLIITADIFEQFPCVGHWVQSFIQIILYNLPNRFMILIILQIRRKRLKVLKYVSNSLTSKSILFIAP